VWIIHLTDIFWNIILKRLINRTLILGFLWRNLEWSISLWVRNIQAAALLTRYLILIFIMLFRLALRKISTRLYRNTYLLASPSVHFLCVNFADISFIINQLIVIILELFLILWPLITFIINKILWCKRHPIEVHLVPRWHLAILHPIGNLCHHLLLYVRRLLMTPNGGFFGRCVTGK